MQASTKTDYGEIKSDQEAVMVFSKGYRKPEVDSAKGKKKESKWAAFLSTNTRLHACTTIKYISNAGQ